MDDDDATDTEVLAFSHMPGVLPIDEHTSGGGQLLPPLPRQPAVHVFDVVLHTRPEVAPPQSASVTQPHFSLARHAAPIALAMQFWVCFGVHSTQWSIASQTSPPEQSGSLRHCTHAVGWTSVLQTPLGGLQSALLLQGSAMHVPTMPVITVQYCPLGQFVEPPMPPSAPTTRQPGEQTPVVTVEVSQ